MDACAWSAPVEPSGAATAGPAPQVLGALMFRVAMRDQAAFKQLYDATSRCLLGIIVRLLRERA